MSDDVANTPVMTRFWCPGCEPDADPMRELLEERYCHRHPPNSGIHRDAVAPGYTEAGGEANRIWCDFFHRKAVHP